MTRPTKANKQKMMKRQGMKTNYQLDYFNNKSKIKGDKKP